MRTFEGIAPMLADELGFEKATQELILATEKLEVAVKNKNRGNGLDI